MMISRQTVHYRSYRWMNRCLGRWMPQYTNLCRYFWPAIISLTLFPLLYIVTFPLWWPIKRLLIARRPKRPKPTPVTAPVSVKPPVPSLVKDKRPCPIWLDWLSGGIRLFKLLGKIRLRRIKPQPLSEQTAAEVCELQGRFVESLCIALGICPLVLWCLLAISGLIICGVGYKQIIAPWAELYTNSFLIFFGGYLIPFGVIFVKMVDNGMCPAKATDAWFVYRHRQGVERFVTAVDRIYVRWRYCWLYFKKPLVDIADLFWEWLMAKKEKVCPFVIFIR